MTPHGPLISKNIPGRPGGHTHEGSPIPWLPLH